MLAIPKLPQPFISEVFTVLPEICNAIKLSSYILEDRANSKYKLKVHSPACLYDPQSQTIKYTDDIKLSLDENYTLRNVPKKDVEMMLLDELDNEQLNKEKTWMTDAPFIGASFVIAGTACQVDIYDTFIEVVIDSQSYTDISEVINHPLIIKIQNICSTYKQKLKVVCLKQNKPWEF